MGLSHEEDPNSPELMVQSPTMKVVCALICENGKVLVAQRPKGKALGEKWEFPGGKIEDGEHPANALSREIMEELGLMIAVGRPLTPHTHSYPEFTITLIPYVCSVLGGMLRPLEHKAVQWVFPHELLRLDLAAADVPIAREYLRDSKLGEK
jgi:8-oxo-dGTP diphosphatase